jgi:hypothetical protein
MSEIWSNKPNDAMSLCRWMKLILMNELTSLIGWILCSIKNIYIGPNQVFNFEPPNTISTTWETQLFHWWEKYQKFNAELSNRIQQQIIE